MYWLLKSEPQAFSIEDLIKAKNKTTYWDGVRNYQARNMLRDKMRKGDFAFFYHSNVKEPGIVGIVQISKEGYPDPTAFNPCEEHYDPKSNPANPRWYGIEVKFIEKFEHPVTLHQLKNNIKLNGMVLLRKGNRLSVMPIGKEHWNIIVNLAKG